MSLIVETPPVPVNDTKKQRRAVTVQDQVTVPAWVDDLETYRRWVKAEELPVCGWMSYLNGEIWLDLTMEELFTHNQVKTAYGFAIVQLLGSAPGGMFVGDRMLFTNIEADLATEPDGLFFFWDTVKSGRLQCIEGAAGFIELSGTPDMALEVVSKHSVRKDTVVLRQDYWKARIPEYWLVDARGPEPRFEILRYTDSEYVVVEPAEGWQFSTVFQRHFQVQKQINPLGQPMFVVNVKE